MAPAQFSLFPSPSSTLPRKTSVRKTPADRTRHANGEANLKGLAFQVVSSPATPVQVEPAPDAIKHTLFCDPDPSELEFPSTASLPVQDFSSNSRRSVSLSVRNRPLTVEHGQSQAKEVVEEDELSPLSSNSPFASRTLSLSRTKPKSNVANKHNEHGTSSPALTIIGDNRESHLSKNTKLSQSTSLVNTDTPASRHHSSCAVASPSAQSTTPITQMRSIFPVYDPTKPLDRQSYYPPIAAESIANPMHNNTSRLSSPLNVHKQRRSWSGLTVVDGNEHMPVAAHDDLEALWNASRDAFHTDSRKVRFGLYQPSSNGKSLAIGTSPDNLIHIMSKDTSSTLQNPAPRKQFEVTKRCPTAACTRLVTQLTLPERGNDSDSSSEVTSIFPYAAAMNAIDATTSSQGAFYTSAPDAPDQWRQAADLAQDAMAQAHHRFGCELIKRARQRDSVGSVTALYDLIHPTLGPCAVTVTKSQSSQSVTGPRAKISLHHPSATPDDVVSDTLNLAFLDFAHDTCVLDMPALLALKRPHIVDTVICALFAVAAAENDAVSAEMVKNEALSAETVTFEAPPRSPVDRQPLRLKRIDNKKFGRRKLIAKIGLGGLALLSKTVKEIRQSNGLYDP